MKIGSSASATLYALVTLHIFVIGYNAYEVNSIVSQNKLDASVINVAGKIRGGIQGAIGQFASDVDFEDTAQQIRANLDLLESSEYQDFLGSGATLVFALDRSWSSVEQDLFECAERRDDCKADIAKSGKDLWNQADTMVDFFQNESDKKLAGLNRLYWILALELLVVTGVMAYIYISISRRLEKEHAENLEYVDIIDRHVITSKTDKDGTIKYASTAFAQISGYRKDELIGRKHNIVKHPEMSPALYDDLWSTISSGKTWEGEIKNMKKDGSHYWVRAFISPRYEGNDIVGYSAVREDITDQKRIEELSTTDSLTGLYNRLKLDDILLKECSRMDRYSHPLSVVIIDLDHFKSVNDTYGHLTGDQVLIELAEVIEGVCRDIDYVGRWGGEEFLIICPETNASEAKVVAEKVRQAIEDYNFPIVGHKTASFGVTGRVKKEKPDRMLARADAALYAAKENGRNRVVVSSEEDGKHNKPND